MSEEKKEKVSLASLARDQYGTTTAPPESAPTWNVPVQSVALPSRGLVYPVDSALHDRDTIEIRSMTAREEDILTSRALLRQGKAMSVLLKSCIMDKSVEPDEMLVGDRNAILIAIRASGYGTDYETKIECPACSEQHKHTFDLSKLTVRSLDAMPDDVGVNAFSFKLPVSKRNVKFKLLTGNEERELSQIQDKTRKTVGTNSVEHGVTNRLLFQVISIDNVSAKADLQRLISTMPAGDSLALRKHIEAVSPGLDTTAVVVCPLCGEEAEVEMPVGADFFWPNAGR